MEEIFAYLNTVHPLHSDTRDYLQRNLKPMEVTRKEFILKRGHICRNIYFISRGLIQCYYMIDYKEISSWFMKEGDIIISVESFFNQKESKESIQALEDSFLFYLSYEELQYAYEQYPDFNSIGRILTEKYYQLSEQRLYSLRLQKAPERYQFLMEHFPQILQRVPLTNIASYLGITLETLSRIRARKY